MLLSVVYFGKSAGGLAGSGTWTVASLPLVQRVSLSPEGREDTHPLVLCSSRSFLFGLGLPFGKSKARDLTHILCSFLRQHMLLLQWGKYERGETTPG